MNKNSSLQSLALGFITCCLATSSAFADAVVGYNSSQISGARADGPYVIGSLFSVLAPEGILVTHLGIQDADAAGDAQDPDGSDGLTGFADDDGFFRDTFGGGGPLEVGLWTGDGATLLASALVSSSDPISGSYRYVQLSLPVTLAPGNYLLGAAVGGGIEWFLDNGSSPAAYSAGSSAVALLENRYALSGTLAAPTSNGELTPGRWAPANAQFVAAPEPSAWLCLASGATGLLLRRRRR